MPSQITAICLIICTIDKDMSTQQTIQAMVGFDPDRSLGQDHVRDTFHTSVVFRIQYFSSI